ncbi:MAG TPA: AraC family transcriptional regulator [Trebonia sp.]
MNTAVEQAIQFICESYEEPLSLADIANKAIMSRFHFCRLFKQHTGITPGRFLSAVRIYHAKRMLLTTSLNITEIAFAVGYNSLGSFSNHFADSVGISPGRFRRIGREGDFRPADQSGQPSPTDGCVSGEVTFPDGYRAARVYVGAFDSPIVQRRPARAALLDLPATDQPATYRLEQVPAGTWYIRAVVVADTTDPEPWTRTTLLVGGCEPVRVAAGAKLRANFTVRPKLSTDLPILLALPDLEARLDGFAPGERIPVTV